MLLGVLEGRDHLHWVVGGIGSYGDGEVPWIRKRRVTKVVKKKVY